MTHFNRLSSGLAVAALATSMLWGCTPEEESKDVTLKGQMSLAGAAAAPVREGGVVRMVSATDYVLYCVTFTAPPHAGTGDFDADGSFSVTIQDAANLPIGCFINDKTTNEPVTTLTFNTGDTGVGGDSASSASFGGGDYTKIVITFDPVTKTATADISHLTQSEHKAVATETMQKLSGEWTMSCADSTDTDCAQFIADGGTATTMPVFVDMLSATETATGKTLYAMGAWPSQAQYTACGSTEGLASVTGVTDLTSTGSADPSVKFAGLPSATGYDAATNSISGDDLKTYFASAPAPYTYPGSGFTSMWNGSYSCPAPGSLNLSTPEHRQCLLEHVASVLENNNGCHPRMGSKVWNGEFAKWDSATANGTTKIYFPSQLGSVELAARYALMKAEVVGDSVVAYNNWIEEWNEWNGSTSKVCHASENMTIAFTVKSDTSAVGKFTVKKYRQCGTAAAEEGLYVFDVNFTK